MDRQWPSARKWKGALVFGESLNQPAANIKNHNVIGVAAGDVKVAISVNRRS
jgi:hypothetical protein